MSDSRLEFELWALSHYGSPTFKLKIDEYVDVDLQIAWEAWQARHQALECEPVAYQYWWPESPRQVTVCKAKYLPNGGPDLIVVPLYKHPANVDTEFDVEKECWRHEAEDLQALHQNLDDAGVPRLENGTELSAWGRVLRTNQNSASAGVPKGYKLVPIELVQWMLRAAPCVSQSAESSTQTNLEHTDGRLSLGQRKAAQVGPVIGVLAQNQDGEVCAVTDMGRCTWLRQDVTGPGDGKTVRLSVHEYTAGIALEALKFYTEWMQRNACGDPEPIEHHYAMQAIDELEALFPNQEQGQ